MKGGTLTAQVYECTVSSIQIVIFINKFCSHAIRKELYLKTVINHSQLMDIKTFATKHNEIEIQRFPGSSYEMNDAC